MEIKEKYLPIGTIVLLNGGEKKLMITGFCVSDEDEPLKTYDYCGCLYPEGFLAADQNCLFDHDQIEKIYYMGYVDDEELTFKKELKEFLEQAKNM